MEVIVEARVPSLIRRNTILLSASQTLYTIVAQVNVLLGALIILGLTNNASLAGLATAIAWGGRLLMAYQSGSLMDRVGRIKILQAGTLLSISGGIVIGLSLLVASFPGTIIGLLVYGLGLGATNQNRVAVADMFPQVRRGEAIGYLMMASVIGALAGPVLILTGTILAGFAGVENLSLHFMAIVWFAGSLLLAPTLLLNRRVHPDPKQIAENIGKFYRSSNGGEQATGHKAREPDLRLSSYPVIAALAISGLAQGNMTMNMALVPLVLHSHNAALVIISLAISIHFIGMYGLSVPLGRLSDFAGRRDVLVLGAIVSGAGALLTPLFSDAMIVSAGIFLVGLGWSAATVSSTALLSDLTPPQTRGKMIGLNDLVLGCTALLFPIVGGIAIAQAGFQGLAAFGALASIPAVFLAGFLKDGPKRSPQI